MRPSPRGLLLAGTTVGYLVVLFRFASSDNPVVTALMLVPVVVAGAMFGMRTVVLLILGLVAVTSWVLQFLGPGLDAQIDMYYTVPLSLLVLVGIVTGRLHDTGRALTEELERRRAVEAELERTRSKMEELLASKDDLIASVGHELRTPLTAVLGFAEMLRLGTQTDIHPEDRQEMVRLIAQEAFRLAGTVDDMLVASRIELGSLTLTKQRVALRSMVLGMTEDLESSLGSRVRVIGPDIEASADRPRVEQVVRNLLGNAFSYGGDTIRVVIYSQGDEAVIEVRDNGPGLPRSVWEEIFDPYYTYHRSETQPRAVGLGLSVSRNLADLMGGSLTYRYVDRESVFTLRLPPYH